MLGIPDVDWHFESFPRLMDMSSNVLQSCKRGSDSGAICTTTTTTTLLQEVRGVKMQTVCGGASISHSRVEGLRPWSQWRETVKILCYAFGRDLRRRSQEASGEAATAAELHPNKGSSGVGQQGAASSEPRQEPSSQQWIWTAAALTYDLDRTFMAMWCDDWPGLECMEEEEERKKGEGA